MIQKEFDLQFNLAPNPVSTYFMRVGSDAMIGAGIHIGDKLVVDKAIKSIPGYHLIGVQNGHDQPQFILIGESGSHINFVEENDSW
jgi:DNA polymerase V